MIARLSRIIPLLIVLAVVAGVVYVVAKFKYSPSRAKEILIRWFTRLTLVLTVFFALFTLYALFEHNDAVFELALSFLITVLVGLGVTRICNAVFLKHHPDYRKQPVKTSKELRFPWNIIKQIFGGKQK